MTWAIQKVRRTLADPNELAEIKSANKILLTTFEAVMLSWIHETMIGEQRPALPQEIRHLWSYE